MSKSVTNNASRQKMQQLLDFIGSKPAEVTGQIEAAEYDWHQPHYFSSKQLSKLDSFTEKVAKMCAEKFTQLYHSDFNVTIVSTTQHFVNEFAASNNAKSDYRLTFRTNPNQVFGIIDIPLQAANIWTTQLLGDTRSVENSDRDLSQLEESLLFDIAYRLIEAFSVSFDHYNFQPAAEFVRGQLPNELEGTEEICKITFSVNKAGTENSSEAYFLILCDKLRAVAGENVQAQNFPAKSTPNTMLNVLQDMPVSVTVQLARTMFNLEEIMNLQVDDILLLDKSVNEPADLIVEGKTLLRGRPAKSGGKLAVVITELCRIK